MIDQHNTDAAQSRCEQNTLMDKMGVSLVNRGRFVGYSSQEEMLLRSMTFQVGLLGTNGWVLASDTCLYEPYPVATGERSTVVPIRSMGSKIVHNQTARMIYAVSGGVNLSREAGEILNRQAGTNGIELDKRREILSEVGPQTLAKFPNAQDRNLGGTLLVIFYDPKPAMWTLDIGGAPVLRESLAFGGAGSLAMLFAVRYYEKTRPVEELTFLAAHSIIEASFFNPSLVDGLELWSCTDGRVERALDTELVKLQERSAQFNELIGTRLHG